MVSEDLQYFKKELFGGYVLVMGLGTTLKALIQAVDDIFPLRVVTVCESGQHNALQMTTKMVFVSSPKACY